MKRFKVLDPGGKCRNGGSGSWHLPKGARPGKWMPKVPVEPCASGYHVCSIVQLLEWLGPEVWIVEVRGKSAKESDKSVHEQGRILAPTYWNETNARLFAADCAEQTLVEFEKHYPNDMRPREAIAVARRFAVGKASPEELSAAGSAAGSAARSAAGSAAGSAARSAARKWQARRLRSYLTGARGRKNAG